MQKPLEGSALQVCPGLQEVSRTDGQQEELETDQGESRERQNPLAPLCLSPMPSNHDVLQTIWILLHFQLPHFEQIPFLANFSWKLYRDGMRRNVVTA